MSKQGLAFYATDTDRYRDRRIRKLRKHCGCCGLAVYDFILCEVYREEGYYMKWDEDTCFDVADYLDLSDGQVASIVEYCCEIGLFHAGRFREGIITSKAIQERYIKVVSKLMRHVEKTSFLSNIDLISTETDIPATETDIPATEKVHSIKGEENTSPTNVEEAIESGSDDSQTETPPSFEKQFKWLKNSWNTICTGSPSISKLSEKRKAKIRTRVKEMGGWEKAMPIIDSLFRKIADSKFLCGDNNRGWRADIDWLFDNDNNWVKVMEGKYDNNRQNGNTTGTQKTRYDPRRGVEAGDAGTKDWNSQI